MFLFSRIKHNILHAALFEAELVKHVKEMEFSMYFITMIDLRRLAFDLVVRVNIAHPFDATSASGLDGVDWARPFAGIRRSPSEDRLHLALHV